MARSSPDATCPASTSMPSSWTTDHTARANLALNVHETDGTVQNMNRSGPSAMLPIFRSEAQFRILGELFTRPGAEFTIGQLAERIEVPHPSVSREVSRLTAAGLLRTRAQGNRTLVSADRDAAVADDLASLLTKLYGPVATLRAALGDLDGIHEALIFGSFAERWQGTPGPAPNDVDLLVVGEVEIDAVWSVAAEVSRQLGVEVNPVVRTPQEWEEERTGFAEAVKRGPRIMIVSGRPEASAGSSA